MKRRNTTFIVSAAAWVAIATVAHSAPPATRQTTRPVAGAGPHPIVEQLGGASSPILIKTLSDVITAAVAARAAGDNARQGQLNAATAIEEVERDCRGFSVVSVADHRRFEAGVFADAENRRRLKPLIDTCRDFGLRLTAIEGYLMRSDEQVPLVGARLELLVRLLSAHLRGMDELVELGRLKQRLSTGTNDARKNG